MPGATNVSSELSVVLISRPHCSVVTGQFSSGLWVVLKLGRGLLLEPKLIELLAALL